MLSTSWVITASIGDPRVRAPLLASAATGPCPSRTWCGLDELLAAFWFAITE